jgi:pimeloyl-ACP methyl ester carboxylesterase
MSDTSQLQRKTAINGDAEIVYYLAGEGPTICLLPSTGRGGLDFIELADELIKAGFKVILPNPRGIGGSKGSLEGINFHDLAADVIATIKAEGGSAIIAGHAYGCWIARTIAADYPDRIKGLVFIAAGAGKFATKLTDAINTAASNEASKEQRIAALRLAFFAPSSDPEPWLKGWHKDVIAAQRKAREATEPASWQHSGNAPILDIVALQDPFRPPQTYQDYTEAFVGRVTQKTVDHASHALPDEHPKQVACHIINWSKNHHINI